MSLTQEPVNHHFKDCYVASQFAYLSDGREYAWYLPYGERLYYKCKQSSTDDKRLLLGSQQEFCIAAVVDVDTYKLNPGDEPRLLRPRVGGRAVVSEGDTATIPEGNALDSDPLVSLADQQDMGFAAAADNEMSLSTATHTSADGRLVKSGKDRYSRPDFVSYFNKSTRGDAPEVDNLTPWLIVELKPPGDPLVIKDIDGYGEESKLYAEVEIRKTIAQALDQARHAFSEYPDLHRFAVLIGCGPFFDFFLVFRPKRYQRDQTLYLTSMENRIKIIDTEDDVIEARPLFSDDKKSFHPVFDRLWDLALQEFRL